MFDLNFIMKVVRYLRMINIMFSNPEIWNKLKVGINGTKNKNNNRMSEQYANYFKVDFNDDEMIPYYYMLCRYFRICAIL